MERVICSVYYLPLTERRNYRVRGDRETGFSHMFNMPAAPRGEYRLLTVPDFEEDYQFSKMAPRTVFVDETTADKVADDLARAWGGNCANEEIGAPGIFVCRDLDVKNEKGKVIEAAKGPSDRELAVNIASQTRWADAWCLEGSDYKVTGRQRMIHEIPHRVAARWLNRKYEWLVPQELAVHSECPVCGGSVMAGKFVCPTCKYTYDEVGLENWKATMIESRKVLDRLKSEAMEANPEMKPEDFENISIGTLAQPKLDAEGNPKKAGNGRHVYG